MVVKGTGPLSMHFLTEQESRATEGKQETHLASYHLAAAPQSGVYAKRKALSCWKP